MRIAFVLGGADCLHDDYTRALALATPDVILATNETGRDHAGHVDHWCTMHPEKLPGWVSQRREAGRPDAGILWRPRHKQPAGLVMQAAPSWGGSSGLLGVTVALLHVEATHVILCGVPLKAENKHYHDTATPWHEAPRYRSSWVKHHNEIRDRVRSMSGWTRELLNEPDKGWLTDAQQRAA